MPVTDPIRLVLELQPGAEPVSGVVLADGVAPRPFEGYVQLIDAVEVARESRGRAAEEPAPEPVTE